MRQYFVCFFLTFLSTYSFGQHSKPDSMIALFTNDVIKLDVDFFSTNNSAFDNFGAEPIEIGSFRDDGYELDEYSQDGIFTAEFELDFSPGEWVPVYKVIMPMATRELRQKPIVLQPNPVSISVETTTDELEFHQLTLMIDDTFVDPDSLIFQGKITFPDRQTEPFAIMEGSGKSRVKKIGYTESGIHRVSLNAFGKTINGREFRLVLPEFSFNVEHKGSVLVPSFDEQGNEVGSEYLSAAQIAEAKKAEEEERLAMELEQARLDKIAAEEEQMQTYIIIGVGNLVILLIAGGVYFVLKRKKKGKEKK